MSQNVADRRIVWLASYPRSGNTWMRIFLSNCVQDAGNPVDINSIFDDLSASDRVAFDEVVGVEVSDMTPDEIERCRPRVYRQMAASSKDTLFVKIHDAFTHTLDGVPLVPESATLGVIYIIRNPMDVAVSASLQWRCPVAQVIERMGDESFAMSADPHRLNDQLRQWLLTWSGHVVSWVDESDLRVHVVRYEDMHMHPLETFRAAVRFTGLLDDPVRVKRAIRFSGFEILRQHGFLEGYPQVDAFFHQGRVGSWREVLTSEHVERLVVDHGDVMRRFGYLTEGGEPVFY